MSKKRDSLLGYLEYAWTVSPQKDNIKVKIRMDPTIQQPVLELDDRGYIVNLPQPCLTDEKTLSFLEHQFQRDSIGKNRIGRLFRACVLHLTTHTLMPISSEKIALPKAEYTIPERLSRSLTNDVYVNAYLEARHPDGLADLAFANTLAFAQMRTAEKISNPATRIIAALLSKLNIGTIKGSLCKEEEETVNSLNARLDEFREKTTMSLAGREIKLEEVLDETANGIGEVLELNGPVLEAPSLKHTEQIGLCSIFSRSEVPAESEIERIFRESLGTLRGSIPAEDPMESCWRRESENEASQAFDSEIHQKTRELKILTQLKEYTQSTHLKSVSFPEEDYTQYLRARSLLQGGSRRLLDSLRVAMDALDEDPGKEMGQLDLPAVIQALAGKKPATDVFLKDEYLSRSFAWAILLDVSASMRVKGEFARALAICVAEATKELLMDPGSWTFYAFSDSLYVLKDSSEAFTRRVRARIGGLRFGGLTYMPDAIQAAGQILTKRYDEQRFLIVISDGWPYGYPDIPKALAESIDTLQKKGVLVIGIGVETSKMGDFFKLNSAIFSEKDLIKRFSKIYTNASATALET